MALEILRGTVYKLKQKNLLKDLQRLEAIVPTLVHNMRDPNFPKTNNKLERFNQYLQRKRTYKKHMKTVKGAQRSAEYLSFPMIMRSIVNERLEIQRKFYEWQYIRKDPGETRHVKAQIRYFTATIKKLNKCGDKYLEFWAENFKIL